jgi:ABC-type phosphonate transport system ATPase subunit
MSDQRRVTMNPKPAGMTLVVSFEDVGKVYGKVRAVDRLPLELWPGHTIAFLGPAGRQADVAGHAARAAQADQRPRAPPFS